MPEGTPPVPAPAPDLSAIEQRNAALEQRLAQQGEQIAALTRNSTTAAAQQQAAQTEARIVSAVTGAKDAVDAAETALSTAHESGESAVIAKAQRTLSEAAANEVRVKAEADQYKRETEAAARQAEHRTAANPELDTSNLDQWKDRNKAWYGIDTDMTRASHEIDQSIRTAGTFKIGTEPYFQAIDRAMKQRFPDRFAGAPASGSARGEQPGSGQKPPRRYSESIQRAMSAFGMTPEQWDASRTQAVSKGILAEAPETGRIRA